MMRKPLSVLAAAGVVLALAVSGCRGGGSGGTNAQGDQTTPPSPAKPTELWPAPSNPLARTVAAGLEPETKESLTFHVHAHLDVFVDGKPVVVPSGIGINIDDPGVKEFHDTPDGSVGYGGIEGCDQPCISPLHTHDATGIVHTESKTSEPNTLGEFFTEWGVRLTPQCVGEFCTPDKPIAVYVNGEPYAQDPRALQLTDHEEIAVVIGTPPTEIPETADFSQA